MNKLYFVLLSLTLPTISESQILVNCNKLTLSQDTFYLNWNLNTHVVGDIIYKDSNMTVYPVLRLILQDTSILKPLNNIYLSFLQYPVDSMEQFDFNMSFKTLFYPHNTVINALFHIYDSDTPGDSVVTCYFPIRLVLQQPVLIKEDQNKNQNLTIYPNPVKSQEELAIKDFDKEGLRFELFDLHGKLMFEQTMSSPEPAIVHIPDLKAGMYFYRIRKEDQTEWKGKILIEHE